MDYIRREFDVDMFGRKRLQLLPTIMDGSHLAVIIDEKEIWPDYVKGRDNMFFWDIKHWLGKTDKVPFDISAKVSERVEDLVKEIG